EPGRDYAYDLAIWPTAYDVAKGHRLQLRLTSYDFPTHLPGTVRAGLDDPGSTTFTPLSPATNTVVTGGGDPSYLRVTALGYAPPAGAAPASAVAPQKHCRRVLVLPHKRGRRFVHAVAYAGRRRVARRTGRDIRRLTVPHLKGPGTLRLRLVLTTRHGGRVVLRRRIRG